MFSRVVVRSSRFVASPLRLALRCQSTNALNKSQLPFTHSGEGPLAVKYTSQHEWIAAHSDGTAFLGITKYAADALGDATYIEIPEADTEVSAGDSVSSVESVKSASEVYTPLSGTVVEGNAALEESPQLINTDPLGEGWIAKIKLENQEEINTTEGLLTLEQYEQSLEHDEH